jgi:hypothetical protein
LHGLSPFCGGRVGRELRLAQVRGGRLLDSAVCFITLCIEPRDDILVRCACDELRSADENFSAVTLNLDGEPLKILEGIAAVRQNIHGVLDSHCADAVQPALHFDAEIVRLGREPVNKQEPVS